MVKFPADQKWPGKCGMRSIGHVVQPEHLIDPKGHAVALPGHTGQSRAGTGQDFIPRKKDRDYIVYA